MFMAICVRRLIEETELFSGKRIAFVASNNMPVANTTSLTTIGNLYDVFTVLFTNARFDLQARNRTCKESDQVMRSSMHTLNMRRSYLYRWGNNFVEVGEFFSAKDTHRVVKKYRGRHGGNALFRLLVWRFSHASLPDSRRI